MGAIRYPGGFFFFGLAFHFHFAHPLRTPTHVLRLATRTPPRLGSLATVLQSPPPPPPPTPPRVQSPSQPPQPTAHGYGFWVFDRSFPPPPGKMVDPASADVQAILQQVGVGYDVVIFYVSSNLVGKRVRETCLCCPLIASVACCYLRAAGSGRRAAWGCRQTKPTDGADVSRISI